MALVEINWQPTRRQLRQFSLIGCVALPLIGWFWDASAGTLGVLAGCGLALAAVGTVFPVVVKPLFLTLSVVAIPIGLVIGELALLSIYFGLFAPLGLVFRLAKRDALQLKLDRQAASYWQEKRPARGASSYYRQS